MKLAVLGTDADILQLAATARLDGHEIVWLGDVRAADAAAISRLDPGLTDRAAQWELLLDSAKADAVLVGDGLASDELRAERVKRLATEAVPQLIIHPAFESVLPYYEVDMIRRETGAIVRHYNPVASHPITSELSEWVRMGHPIVGPIHQLTFERRVTDTSRTSVLAHLARDVELMAAAAGDVRRVSAIGPAMSDANFAALQIQLASTHLTSLRWSVVSAAKAGTGFELTLVGERGAVTLRGPLGTPGELHDAWQLDAIGHGRDERLLDRHNAPLVAIQQLADATAAPNSELRATMSSWEAATRAMEVVDAVELSLQRGRTIEVYQQQLTERLAFRGTMAAIGCGLLLVAFAAILLVTVLGGAEGRDRPLLIESWPLALLAVLAFFLLLQGVPLLARKSRADGREGDRRHRDG